MYKDKNMYRDRRHTLYCQINWGEAFESITTVCTNINSCSIVRHADVINSVSYNIKSIHRSSCIVQTTTIIFISHYWTVSGEIKCSSKVDRARIIVHNSAIRWNETCSYYKKNIKLKYLSTYLLVICRPSCCCRKLTLFVCIHC